MEASDPQAHSRVFTVGETPRPNSSLRAVRSRFHGTQLQAPIPRRRWAAWQTVSPHLAPSSDTTLTVVVETERPGKKARKKQESAHTFPFLPPLPLLLLFSVPTALCPPLPPPLPVGGWTGPASRQEPAGRHGTVTSASQPRRHICCQRAKGMSDWKLKSHVTAASPRYTMKSTQTLLLLLLRGHGFGQDADSIVCPSQCVTRDVRGRTRTEATSHRTPSSDCLSHRRRVVATPGDSSSSVHLRGLCVAPPVTQPWREGSGFCRSLRAPSFLSLLRVSCQHTVEGL